MCWPSRGAAFMGADPATLCADRGFVAALGLDVADPAAALATRAGADGGLAQLLAGDGGGVAELVGAGGDRLLLEYHPVPGGALLVLKSPGDAARLELAGLALGLAGLAGGLAHDIRNHLNGMALQLELLSEKLGEAGAGVGGHLAALRDQVTRVGEVVSRYAEVADPEAPEAPLDLGGALAGLAVLFGAVARRRHVRLELAAPPGLAGTAAPTARTLALLVGLLGRAVAEAPHGGVVAVRTAGGAGVVTLSVAHAVGAEGPDLGYDSGMAAQAARALGGALSRRVVDGQALVTLQLPGVERS
ncbi:MAG: HAMP domain-containing histidine kinase [Anaeromyxobacter sp.]|nr:HAMP domain-containing histidine kinase [Anaeromyxobacter sp.]MBL0277803.1 HAMP domain-containing histidine kinase [Anaeromyxobacter sp.]